MPENKEVDETQDNSGTGTSSSVIAAMKALQNHSDSDDDDDDEIPKASAPKYIDPSTLVIEDGYEIADQKQDVQNIFGFRPSFQVVCSQSGYMAKISSLVYNDVFNMTNSNLSNYENKKEIYKIIYSKITGFSAADWKPSFEDWLKATSFGDLDTLYYGLYCSTFQERSAVTYECPICGESNTIDIDNSQLVRVNDKEEMLALTTKITSEANTAAKIKEFSLIDDKPGNYTCIELPNSKLVFKLKMPSLWDVLELIRSFSDEVLAAKAPNTINIVLMTKDLLMPKTGADKKPVNPPKYSRVASKKDIFGMLDILSVDDYAALNAAATKMLEDKHIAYEIEDQICSNCQNKIKKIPMDMENLLFFQIRERRL